MKNWIIGLNIFRISVIGVALFQIISIMIAVSPLVKLGMTKEAMIPICATLFGSIIGCFIVLYPVELLYDTHKRLVGATSKQCAGKRRIK
jgi:hypothetical protein